LVLAVLNTFVRPLLVLLSIGWVIITFGVFLIVVNALLLMLTSKIVPGFTVDGFWTAFFGSIIISIISGVLGLIGKTKVRVATNTIPPPSSRPPSGKGPVIDI
jgi:putative membrane protein